MNTKRVILSAFIAMTMSSFGQLDQFSTVMAPMLSEPVQHGFMRFNAPNAHAIGQCFQDYKVQMSDNANDMILINSHIDELTNMTHYKFQQIYKGVPVEFAGCIEHYNTAAELVFTNAKHAIDINQSHIPFFNPNAALGQFFSQLPPGLEFAWLDPQIQMELQEETGNSSATYFPTPELLFAIDEPKDMDFNIDGSRYRLAYKITVTTKNPFMTKTYYMDANNADIFRIEGHTREDGPAYVLNPVSTVTIDTEWAGGFTQAYILYAQNGTQNIHTKKKTGIGTISSWGTVSNVTDDDDDWAYSDVVETTAHFYATQSWDYFESIFNRSGWDNNGMETRVRTQWDVDNAQYENLSGNKGIIRFGVSPANDFYSNELAIVGHEFTHGIIGHTANLTYSNESGALNESFSDIFGIVIESWYQYGNLGLTDWVIGNHINQSTVLRSLANPDSSSQPDTYNGQNWYTGSGDNGGVHTNSGVGNKWFFLLSDGEWGTNDNGDSYALSGIGMHKAANISYLALTSYMDSGDQYADAREATIEAAKQLYGECSFEYQETIDAWYAVGVGNQHTCTYTLNTDDLITDNDVLVYPNPTNDNLYIRISAHAEKEITIYDVSGQLVVTTTNSDEFTHIDVSSFATGLYTVICNIGGNIIAKKVIIE